MKLMKKIAIFLFAQSVLFFSACRTGVDDSVDLKGPTVTIISPEARENVGEKFDIRCTVTDDFAVGLVTVELDGNIWQHKGSTWQYKPKDGSNFVPDTQSEWIAENKKKVEFVIKDATIQGSGTFTIKITAIDESGNISEESTKSRDVIIDKDAPVITLSAPYVTQEPETFKAITDYRDITKISQFLTGDFTISGKTTEENGIQSVEVRITEYGADNELFIKRIVQDEAYKNSESDIVVDTLRSWEIPVRLAEWAGLDKLDEKQHILSISTSACDTAGNDSGWTRQGYACMWKEADKPWIDIILGTTKDSAKYVYSGSSLLGNAYDDTAIKSVNVTIKKTDGEVYGNFDKKQIYSASEEAEEENNVYFELPLPKDSDDYSVEITAADNNGTVSDKKTGWIKVVDKTFPSIEITHNAESGKLFFDQKGNFTLKMTSQDDTKVASVKMAYITDIADIVNYSNSSYKEWNTVSTSLNDLVNKKVLAITPKDTGKTTTENNFTRKIYENEVTMNIFDHLKIDGSTKKLTNQSFVFRVEDGDGNALTSTYAIQGDIEAPKIEFTKIEYYSYEGDGGHVGDFKAESTEMLPSFGEKTYVIVHGKISDNSTDILKDYKKYLALELTANGIKIAPNVQDNGTFTARADSLTGASLVFEGTLTDWGGNSQIGKYSFLVDSQTPRIEYISAVNNDGYYGESSAPIDIFIRFNKKLVFTGNTSITLNNGATISYDENITKQYVTEKKIGENDILFQYKISSHPTESTKLNVESADFGTITYNNANVTPDINDSFDEIIKKPELGKNLGDMKNIGIIIGDLTVENVSFNTAHDTLTITYNKRVAKRSGEVTITQDPVSKVPTVLKESDGNTLFALSPDLKNYYELTTNGATKDGEKFNADLTSKYVLKYEYNSNGTKDSGGSTNLIDDYLKTNRHILKQDVRAQGVSINDNKVTVKFSSPLPCKGATYTIDIPAGFVQDENGGENFQSKVYNVSEYKYTGVEPPVIRINRNETKVEGKKAEQPLTTTFKVDCETPGATVNCEYTYYTKNALAVVGRGTNQTPVYFKYDADFDKASDFLTDNVTQIESYNKFPYEKTTRSSGTTTTNIQPKNGSYEIGTTEWQKGLEYNITATVDNVKSYAVAYRTVIEINGLSLLMKDDPDYGLFIIGGDSPLGSNTVQGLPTSWDITKSRQTRFFTEINPESGEDFRKKIVLRQWNEQSYRSYQDENDNWNWKSEDTGKRKIFYFTSWGITTDYYFMVLRGKIDNDTDGTPGGGPSIGTMAQNSYVSYYAQYPINPGGYIKILNGISDWAANNVDESSIKNRDNGTEGDSATFGDKEINFTNR